MGFCYGSRSRLIQRGKSLPPSSIHPFYCFSREGKGLATLIQAGGPRQGWAASLVRLSLLLVSDLSKARSVAHMLQVSSTSVSLCSTYQKTARDYTLPFWSSSILKCSLLGFWWRVCETSVLCFCPLEGFFFPPFGGFKLIPLSSFSKQVQNTLWRRPLPLGELRLLSPVYHRYFILLSSLVP